MKFPQTFELGQLRLQAMPDVKNGAQFIISYYRHFGRRCSYLNTLCRVLHETGIKNQPSRIWPLVDSSHVFDGGATCRRKLSFKKAMRFPCIVTVRLYAVTSV